MKLSKIERLILAYLRKHPDAKETRAGHTGVVASGGRNRQSRKQSQRAIAHLVSAEFILKGRPEHGSLLHRQS